MTTRISISEAGAHRELIRVRVSDDTGRDQQATMPRYPAEGSAMYVTFVDALDLMMATWEDRRGAEQGQPLTPSSYSPSRADE